MYVIVGAHAHVCQFYGVIISAVLSPSGFRLIANLVFPGMGSIIKIRRSLDHLIFIMEISVLVIRHLYIETHSWYQIRHTITHFGLLTHVYVNEKHSHSTHWWHICTPWIPLFPSSHRLRNRKQIERIENCCRPKWVNQPADNGNLEWMKTWCSHNYVWVI